MDLTLCRERCGQGLPAVNNHSKNVDLVFGLPGAGSFKFCLLLPFGWFQVNDARRQKPLQGGTLPAAQGVNLQATKRSLLQAEAETRSAGAEQRDQSAKIGLMADEQHRRGRGMEAMDLSDEFFQAAGGRQVIGKLGRLLVAQTVRDDFRRLPGASERAGENGVEFDFHFPQGVSEKLGALGPLGRQRAFVLRIPRVAVLHGIAMTKNVKFHSS